MRIAVIADIHGNLPALEAVVEDLDARRPDVVLVAGDIVNRGPRPRECLELVLRRRRDAGWRVIRGNHEDYVLAEARPPADRPDWIARLCRHSAWTCERLGERLATIAELPHQIDFDTPDGQHVCCVHASKRGNRVGLYEQMDDDELQALIAPPDVTWDSRADPFAGDPPDVTCVGHTHVPFIRRLNHRLVVNAGAVGMPFDGDTRASYGWLERRPHRWQAAIVRLAYDRERAARAFAETGFLDTGGPMAPLIRKEFERARPVLSRWHRDYEAAVRTGGRDIDETVRELLTKLE